MVLLPSSTTSKPSTTPTPVSTKSSTSTSPSLLATTSPSVTCKSFSLFYVENYIFSTASGTNLNTLVFTTFQYPIRRCSRCEQLSWCPKASSLPWSPQRYVPSDDQACAPFLLTVPSYYLATAPAPDGTVPEPFGAFSLPLIHHHPFATYH